jgi:hypothetical protein
MSIEECTRKWTEDQKQEMVEEQPQAHRVVVWLHDESMFYVNGRRKLHWVHKNETAVPCAKGEGASLMVTDFVSADYGWLRSPEKTKEARVFFRAGKNRKGYFTNEDILNQTTTAIDILTEFYPNKEHHFVFDNATTHTKRSDMALSACHMPKGTKPVGEFSGAIVPVLDSDGNQVYSCGQTKSTKIINARSAIHPTLNYLFYCRNILFRTYKVDIHKPILPNR